MPQQVPSHASSELGMHDASAPLDASSGNGLPSNGTSNGTSRSFHSMQLNSSCSMRFDETLGLWQKESPSWQENRRASASTAHCACDGADHVLCFTWVAVTRVVAQVAVENAGPWPTTDTSRDHRYPKLPHRHWAFSRTHHHCTLEHHSSAHTTLSQV